MAKTTKAKAKAKEDRIKLMALSNLTGVYLLPFSEGDEFTIDAKRGQELVDNKDAKIIK